MNYQITIYFIISFLLLYLISKFSYKLDFVDLPTKRKRHAKPTAYTGGLAITSIYIFSILLFDINNQKLNLILSMGFLISIVGFIDDKWTLNAGGKLSLQIIPIIYMIVVLNLKLNTLGNYYYFVLSLNSFSIPFTLISVLLLINSCNYFDGLDGTLSFTSLSTLSIIYFLILDENIRLFIILISIPLCIFLFFNFSIFKLPKLFLGDSGSLLIGFIISFLLIFVENKNFVHPILLGWSVSVYVFEFISINLIRLKSKRDPFNPGNDHLHHLLFYKTQSIFLTNTIIISINIVLFIMGYFIFKFISPIASLILFVIFLIIFIILRNKYSI
tara:strand:+ start:2816 stop:3805 length:990 start_codon:yes stop_codon:yes gene_type:complete